MKVQLDHNLDPRYLEIADVVHKYIDSFDYDKNIKKRFEYRSKVVNDEYIDYNQYVLEFAQLYWLRNYWKAVYLYEYEFSLKKRQKITDKPLKILSLGAGSASDIVALMAYLAVYCPITFPTIEIELIDLSQKQLELARKIINKITPYVSELNFEVEYISLNTNKWEPKKDDTDILVMGHFLTANVQKLQSILKKGLYNVKPNGDILIMERERDDVWKKASQELSDLGLISYSSGLIDNKFEHMLESLPTGVIDPEMTPHYLKARLPENKYQLDIVKKYFESWRFKTADLLEEIFVIDAIFNEKPGIEPAIKGLNAIQKYWYANPLLQSNINLWIRGLAYGDYNIVCAFEGDFDTPKQHISIKGALSFFVDEYYQKVRNTEIYFGTKKTPHCIA